MKYTNEIEIDAPIGKVIELFDNPELLKEWQPGLESFEHLDGTAGQPGAKSKLKFKLGKREMEMIETIIVRDLPHEFSGTYETNGVHNIVRNYFTPISDSKTKYLSENEFQFTGFMKVIAFLMPGMFKKQTQKYLENFKAFVEKNK